MANNMYTKLFMQVNKLFKEDYLLKDNIPEDILNWTYHNRDIKLEGKVLQIDAIPDKNIFIIKDKYIDNDFIGGNIIMLDNKPCKFIVISKDFLDNDVEHVQSIIYDIYNDILQDLFTDYKGCSIHIVNKIAPYILTINTMQSFLLTFSYSTFNIKDKTLYRILQKSCDYDLSELLDNGLLMSIVNEIERNRVEE